MAVTITRGSHQLTIHSVARRADGRVVITFSVSKAGFWIESPPTCRAYPPGDANGFPMTAAYGDPQHATMPLLVAAAGTIFTYVWDAVADGYPAGSLNGWCFKLGYIDIYCCDEVQTDDEWIPDPVPPGSPPPPVPPPPPGVPVPPPSTPMPGDTSIPPGENYPEDPNAGNEQDPGVFTYPGGDSTMIPDSMRLPDGSVVRREGSELFMSDPDGNWYPISYEEFRQVIDSLPPGYIEEQFATFEMPPNTIDQTPDPEAVLVEGALGDLREVQTEEPVGLDPSNPLSYDHGFNDPTLLLDYPIDNDWQAMAAAPAEAEGVTMKVYTAIESYEHEFFGGRIGVYGLIHSDNEQNWGGGELYYKVTAIDHDGTPRLIQEPTTLEVYLPYNGPLSNVTQGRFIGPGGSVPPNLRPPGGGAPQGGGTPPPPGNIPPGVSGVPNICVQVGGVIPPGTVQVFVSILNSLFQPIITAHAMMTSMLAGSGAYPGSQTGNNPSSTTPVDHLGPEVRQYANLKNGIIPRYEGSYAGVGDEDTHVVTIARNLPAFVVSTSADAINSGFEPEMLIYDVNDMVNPVVTVRNRFRQDGADISPTTHILGYRDDAGLLTLGFKYAIVVKHRYPFYSKRWVYGIWHAETNVVTGGTFNVDGNGNLTGQISCAYGRQSIMLFNDRTDEHIFVKTDEIGVAADIQANIKGGSLGKYLPVTLGDKVEIIRPGPALLYRRDGDNIGEATVV